MEWLRENGFWVFVFIMFIVVHLFGHGGHGGHGTGQGTRRENDKSDGERVMRSKGHRH